MRFLKPGNFNGLIFRDGMVFVYDIGKWITKEEYKKYGKFYTLRHNNSYTPGWNNNKILLFKII